MTKKKRPKDANQLAKLIVDIATGEQEESTEKHKPLKKKKRKK